MIISVWRYSHLALAVSSFLFLAVAALTGIVLAFEPVIDQSQGFRSDALDTLTLSHSIPLLKKQYPGIQELKVDDNEFVIIKYADKEGKDRQSYVDPVSGQVLGTPKEQSPLFKWMTALHRSLFLHDAGRIIVGITAFLLLLIALSGIALVVQRQKGFRKFFAPIERTGFAQYYHVVFGRIALFFIVAVALTGAYLSVSRFIVKPERTRLFVDEKKIREEPELKTSEFSIFKQTKLNEVEQVQFPFSDFPEDYFTLKLKTRELAVNQFTGDVLASQTHSRADALASFSLRWHTGRSNPVWAVILAVTSGYILFFIYSGFVIMWKRMRSRSRNQYKADECNIVILVGSENGSTYRFASVVYQQLLRQGERVYLADMDNYHVYPAMNRLIVMTSTYGEGDPPSNARRFLARMRKHPQASPIKFAVLAFGSRTYDKFCAYGYEVDSLLNQQAWAVREMEAFTVNDHSPQDFSDWLVAWSAVSGFSLSMPPELLTPHLHGVRKMKVVHTNKLEGENAFTISLKTNAKFVSGDLLAIYPQNDHRERLYSIGRVNNHVHLSVKLLDQGLGSQFLYALEKGDSIKARIVRNQHFHFPSKAKSVLMVANGTGIAPFLGMISENARRLPIHLYCGFRKRADFKLYDELLMTQRQSGALTQLRLALSREEDQRYVSHMLTEDAAFVLDLLSSGGVLMICGSLAMQKDVMAALAGICGPRLHGFHEKGQIVSDCY